MAIVSDVHGNLRALEAVIEALRGDAPDIVLHGGDLAHGGARPAEVVDRIRELGWRGVLGNTDELLFRPESLREAAEHSAGLRSVVGVIEEMATWTREQLGAERLQWLRGLGMSERVGEVAVVHASPGSCWVSAFASDRDEKLRETYSAMGSSVASYGHIHTPFVRRVGEIVVANSGSAGMAMDWDVRASYLVIEDGVVEVRRVKYGLEAEIRELMGSGMPHAEWTARVVQNARAEMP